MPYAIALAYMDFML